MLQKYDAAVIGGGIIGLSCAYYLTREGKRVIVLEKGAFGNGASGACDDMILFQSKKPGINLELAFESLEIYRGLSQELGTPLGFETRGGMVLIQNDSELAVMEEFVRQQREYGLDVTILDGKAMRKKQPYLGEDFLASTYSPMDAQVDPFAVMYGFYHRGRELGMEVRKQTAVTAVDQDAGGDYILTTSRGDRVGATLVVNACGAWAGESARLAGLSLPVAPKRGQIVITEKVPAVGDTNLWSAKYLVTKLKPGTEVPATEEEKALGLAFAFTRSSEGSYLIGSTREMVGFDKGTTMEGIRAMVRQAVSCLPVLKNVHFIRAMAGLRPSTPDGKMILGEHPEQKGYWIAAGHEGDGISLAPVTGKLLAGMICRGEGKQRLEELSPGRFVEQRAEAGK